MKQSGFYKLSQRYPASRGLIINGAAGTGKTTLGKEVAARLGFKHMDLDDYYFSRESEFAGLRPRAEIIQLLQDDLNKHPHFVMSGSIGSILWDFVNPLFNLAILLSAPTDLRVQRITARAYERFGNRALEGGDLYDNHQQFYEQTKQYDTGFHSVSRERHEKWASELECPVLRLDGALPIADNVEIINAHFLSL